ncbi:Sugar phosphate isomerase/epimerase [Hydrobacter penzbergensis]|jgi:sugar phosphate isomerase/epimerase|uniref:Sugar phosphate isomerase/epimerase n=1 Tax=Hydrobacter penzbergensis TaxID=1235997 RepID=A0A8X8LEN4_9BACT|nr:sugar phosphate isomerase/epimerase [Hydrobacter penzbergensis]SDW71998.1 Sugar phosphate isomerase/epimerase [Hydrobacter penzbergensis]
MSSSSRRDFLRGGAFAALGLALPFKGKSSLIESFAASKKLNAFGLQLWTVKEDMARDAKDTLKKVASYGYKQIESFEGKSGMFWGMSNKDFSKYLDGLGTRIISSHCNISTDFEKKAAEAAEIGMKYLICPYKGPQKSIDQFKKFADEFNKAGEICKKNGIRFAYHNHDYSFKPVDGQLPQEVMMNNTDKDLVDFEMDIYWVVAAGESPEAWFKKHPNRFRLCHVKDYAKTANGHESVQLGKGTIDFHSILKAGTANGLRNYIVEQEAFTGSNPLDSAAADAKYMKAFAI